MIEDKIIAKLGQAIATSPSIKLASNDLDAAQSTAQTYLEEFKQLFLHRNEKKLDVGSVLEMAIQAVSALSKQNEQLQSTEKQLQQSEARWRYFWESMPDVVAEIDMEGNIILANRALYGGAREAESSRSLFDHVPDERQAALRQVINKVKLTQVPHVYELPLLDGNQVKWWANRIIPVMKDEQLTSLFVIISDVTERKMAYQKIEQQVQERTQVLIKINQELKDEIYTRKQIEASLRESESRYYRLTSICPVGIFRSDSKGRTIYMNERCAEMVGLALHEALGYGWAKTIHPDDYERAMKETSHAWENQLAYKTKLRHLHRDGRVVWVVAEFLTETDESGNFKGFIGTLTNVTPLVQVEEKLREHQLKFEHRARIDMVGEMISGIAHEINQPLAMIVNYTGGCLEYLQHEKNISPEITAMMQRVFDQAERAGKIIHRLKEFLKKGTLEKEKVNVNFAVREAVSLVRGVLQDFKVDLKLNLREDLPSIFIDKIQIEQVILNLIHNAVDAMDSSDWLFRQISIQTQYNLSNPKLIDIRISDSGPGIPEEIAANIFDAFFTTKEKGMGVGLSISATILEVHGGRITLDRDYKDGTSFVVTLPIEDRSEMNEKHE